MKSPPPPAQKAIYFLAIALLALWSPGCGRSGPPESAGRVLASAQGLRVGPSRPAAMVFEGQRVGVTSGLSVSFFGPPRFRLGDAFDGQVPSDIIGLSSEGFEMRYNTEDGELICSVRAKKASWGISGGGGEMAATIRLSQGVLVEAGQRRLRAPRIELSYQSGAIRVQGPWALHGPQGTRQGEGLDIDCALIVS